MLGLDASKKLISVINAKGQFISRWFLNLLIRKSIQSKGTKPVNFTEPYYDNLEYLEKDLAKELSQDTADMIVGYLQDINFTV